MDKVINYDRIKESGTEWLGEIPEEWGLEKIGSLYTLRSEKVSDKDFRPLSVTMKGIVPQLESAAKTNDGDNRKLVKSGDFAINSRSDRRGSCGISEYDGSVSLINIILTPRGKMHPAFYNWLFHTSLFSDEFYKWGHGIVDDLWTTRWQEMKRIIVPVPPYEVQDRIARYLDEQCAQIDSIISEAKASIEDYKTWKASIIYEAVTKGLDPNAEMKDSGVEWIGKISGIFTKKKIKMVADIFGRIGYRGYTTSDLVPEGYGAITLSPSNILDGKMLYTKCSFISWIKYNESPEIMVENGDVLMVKTGASYGKTSIVYHLPCEATINPQLIVFKNIKINNKYFTYFMQTPIIKHQIEGIVTGGTIPTMSQNKLGNLFLFVPNGTLQDEIVSYLDRKCGDIDSLIAEKQSLITDLEAYKKSLIYEVVTGKRKVV